jgi:hypothetical protein
MATTTTPRIPVGWLATTTGGVALVFAGGYLTAGGHRYGLVLIAVAAAGVLVARVSSLPARRRYRTAVAVHVPRQRTGPTNTRRSQTVTPGRDRGEQRAIRGTARPLHDHPLQNHSGVG